MSYSHWNDQTLKLPALHQAARRGNLTQVKKLLKGKAKVNEANEFGDTPIMWAAYEGNASVVAYLIAVGANVKAADKEKTTPLHLATMGGHCEIVAALLAKGANAKALDSDGLTALNFAVAGDYPDAIQLLTQSKVNTNMRSGIQNMTALHFAAYYGHPAAIRALIKGGADVNRAAKRKVTPLHMAAYKNRDISGNVLIGYGANLNAKDGDGGTPLHWAAQGGHKNIVEALLDAGANINTLDGEGNTPLYYAQKGGHYGVAKMLIDSGEFPVATSPESKNTAEEVFKKVSRSIVYIQTGSDGEGSGVIVGKDLVATNWHVVEDDVEHIRVHKAEKAEGHGIQIDVLGRFSEGLVATVWGSDSNRDFCLLHVPDLDGEVVEEIRPYHDLRVGEEVYAIGNPLGETHTLSAGVISQKREDEESRMIQTNAAISEGSSGGGLFDKDGNLIGITTGFLKDGQNINYAIAADLLWGFLPGKR